MYAHCHASRNCRLKTCKNVLDNTYSVKDASFATVFVGIPKTRFVVHEELLTYHSSFFRAALNGCFKEAESKTVILEDTDPQIFEFFVHWLYHQRLPTEDDAPGLHNAWTQENDCGGSKTGNLIRIYIFCDTYDIPTLKIRAMNELFMHMELQGVGLPNSEQVQIAFDRLPHHSPLCRYLIDVHCCYADHRVWDDIETCAYPWPFLTKVMQRYTRFANKKLYSVDDLTVCDYHEHEAIDEIVDCLSNVKRD